MATAVAHRPCWFYNQGGCTKTAKQCIFDHIRDPNMRKPLHLQHPCKHYHYITPMKCRFGVDCRSDHFYELTPKEWEHHFPNVAYPGAGYLSPKPVQKPIVKAPAPRPVQKPIVQAPVPKPMPQPVVQGAWAKPLTVKVEKVLPVKLPPAGNVKVKPQKGLPKIAEDFCWADCEDEEEVEWESEDEVENDLDDDPDWWGSDEER